MYDELGGLLDALRLAHEGLVEETSCNGPVCVGASVPTAIGRVHNRDRCMQFTDAGR